MTLATDPVNATVGLSVGARNGSSTTDIVPPYVISICHMPEPIRQKTWRTRLGTNVCNVKLKYGSSHRPTHSILFMRSAGDMAALLNKAEARAAVGRAARDKARAAMEAAEAEISAALVDAGHLRAELAAAKLRDVPAVPEAAGEAGDKEAAADPRSGSWSSRAQHRSAMPIMLRAVLCAVLGALAFANSLDGEFVMDDGANPPAFISGI